MSASDDGAVNDVVLTSDDGVSGSQSSSDASDCDKDDGTMDAIDKLDHDNAGHIVDEDDARAVAMMHAESTSTALPRSLRRMQDVGAAATVSGVPKTVHGAGVAGESEDEWAPIAPYDDNVWGDSRAARHAMRHMEVERGDSGSGSDADIAGCAGSTHETRGQRHRARSRCEAEARKRRRGTSGTSSWRRDQNIPAARCESGGAASQSQSPSQPQSQPAAKRLRAHPAHAQPGVAGGDFAAAPALVPAAASPEWNGGAHYACSTDLSDTVESSFSGAHGADDDAREEEKRRAEWFASCVD